MRCFQLAFPKRITLTYESKDLETAQKIIRKYNGKVNIYRSVHDFINEPSAKNAIMEKIFLDFDYDENNPNKCLIDVMKTSDWLSSKNYEHRLFFSGRGFHCFVKAEFKKKPKNMSMALKNCYLYLSDAVNIEIDHTYDLMRVARLPNTLNLRSRRYCIPLKRSDLQNGYEWICEKARERDNHSYVDGGSRKLKLDKFDNGNYFKNDISLPCDNLDIDMDVNPLEFPPCVRCLFKKGECGYRDRFLIILAFRELCYPKEVVKRFLKGILSKRKYYHCVYEEKQVDYLYERDELVFPSCSTLRREGYCKEVCECQEIYL